MKKVFLSAFISLFMLTAFSAQAAENKKKNPPKIVEKVADMEFSYKADGGMQLKLFGMPMIRGTAFWVMKPKWVERYYGAIDNPDIIRDAKVEKINGGKRITLNHKITKDKSIPFSSKEIYTLLPDNSITMHLEMETTLPDAGIFEWEIAQINAAPFFGREAEISAKNIKIKPDPATGKYLLPLVAAESDLIKSILIESFDSIKINSLIGPVEIKSKTDDKIAFLDYRRNTYAKPESPIFWMGIIDREIENGKKYSYDITINFPKKFEFTNKAIDEVKAEAKSQSIEDAQIPNWGRNYIIPQPKDLKYTEKRFMLASPVKIYTGKNPNEEIINATDFLKTDLENMFKLNIEIVKDEMPAGSDSKGIMIGEKSRYAKPDEICSAAGLKLNENEEAYCLFADEQKISVSANTSKGIFYGVTTLAQLISVDKSGIYIKGAEISDYPSLKFRGVHFLSGKKAGDEIAKAVRTLLARYKMNSLVWECEYIIWDSYPELEHKEYAMTKKDAQKVVDAAKKNSVELIPLVQSLGHSEWIFSNDKNLDLAEDPENPYAYNTTNPDTYKFIFKVYQEALDFFKPRVFHIGHDEVNTSASRFPYKSKDSGKSTMELILEDINKLHTFFKERNVQVMMWGDMFLHPNEAPDAAFADTMEEATTGRAQLPKDIIIADWHYVSANPEKFTSLGIWKKEGFQAIGSGWYTPTNIQNLSAESINVGSLGYLQTTWAGFNFKISDNNTAWHQYWAYILAAHYSWSGDRTAPEKLPFIARAEFLDNWFDKKPILETKAGDMLDLSSAYNRRLDDDEKRTGWMQYGPEFDFSSVPTGVNTFKETKFLINKNSKNEGAIFLAGKTNPDGSFPKKVVLNVEEKQYSEMHFLLNSTFNAEEGKTLGTITIKYSGGSSENIDLKYGKNIFSFTDGRVSFDTQIAWSGKTKSEAEIYIFDLKWKNPKSDKKIKEIVISSAIEEASPIIFAVTGVK